MYQFLLWNIYKSQLFVNNNDNNIKRISQLENNSFTSNITNGY